MRMRTGPVLITALLTIAIPSAASKLGLFSMHQDVGSVTKKGKAKYDGKRGTYTVTGDGANIWGSKDAFQYVYEQVSGDVSLQTGISWVGQGGEAHRKAGIMIRQALTPDAPYVDVMVHGNGMTSLQYRETAGGTTKEVQSTVQAPKVIRIERQGDEFTIAAGDSPDNMKTTGPLTLHLGDPVYIGFAVSAHHEGALETAVFSAPKIQTGSSK